VRARAKANPKKTAALRTSAEKKGEKGLRKELELGTPYAITGGPVVRGKKSRSKKKTGKGGEKRRKNVRKTRGGKFFEAEAAKSRVDFLLREKEERAVGGLRGGGTVSCARRGREGDGLKMHPNN